MHHRGLPPRATSSSASSSATCVRYLFLFVALAVAAFLLYLQHDVNRFMHNHLKKNSDAVDSVKKSGGGGSAHRKHSSHHNHRDEPTDDEDIAAAALTARDAKKLQQESQVKVDQRQVNDNNDKEHHRNHLLLFLHPDAVCGKSKQVIPRIKVAFANQYRAPLQLAHITDTVTNEHPSPWPPADHEEQQQPHQKKKHHKSKDAALLSVAASPPSEIPAGIHCLAVTDARSCPKSLGLFAIPPGGVGVRRDPSEFAVFPFNLRSVHDVGAASYVDVSTTCTWPDLFETQRTTITLTCHDHRQQKQAQNNIQNDVITIRARWPRRVPSTNPVLPVILVDVDAELRLIKNSNARAATISTTNNNNNNKSATIATASTSFSAPKLRITSFEAPTLSSKSEAVGVLINGKGVTKLLLREEERPEHDPTKVLRVHHEGNNNNDDHNKEEVDDAATVLRPPRLFQGETDEGVLHRAVLTGTSSQVRQIISMEQGFLPVHDAAAFLTAVLDESQHSGKNNKNSKSNNNSANRKPLCIHVLNSMKIDGQRAHNLVIPAGTTFAVCRGCTIEFTRPVKMLGTVDDPIFFTSAKLDQFWGGLIVSSSSAELQHVFISNTGGARATIKGVGTHIKHACPAIVVRPGASLSLDSVAIIGGKGSGVTSGKHSTVNIVNSVFFDLAQGGEFVASTTTIERTHALHFMLREKFDEFRDDDNDGFYFRDGVASLRDSVVFGSRDDCIDTASSKNQDKDDDKKKKHDHHNHDEEHDDDDKGHNRNNNNSAAQHQRRQRHQSLIIENTLLANCQHEGVALSGSVGTTRSVQILDSTVRFAQQGIENGHTPSTHSALLEGVNIEDCGIGLRLGDNYMLDVSGSVEVGADVSFSRCALPVLNLLREDKHRTWQLDGPMQDPRQVKVHPATAVDGQVAAITSMRSFCGREMFSLLDALPVGTEAHEPLLIL